MSTSLLNAFSLKDFKNARKRSADLVELTFKVNPTSGAKFVRAVFEDGSFLVKQVSDEIAGKNVLQFPRIESVAQRTKIIKELNKEYTQQDIAAMLDISQATVSTAIHIVNRKESNYENH